MKYIEVRNVLMYFTIIFNNTVSASLEYNKIIDYMKKQNISAVTKFFVKRCEKCEKCIDVLHNYFHNVLIFTMYWCTSQLFLITLYLPA